MAEKSRKAPGNAEGPWYVDDTCIACQACVDAAPACFRMADGGLAYVFAQPADAQAAEDCQVALEACPVQAIGNDA